MVVLRVMGLTNRKSVLLTGYTLRAPTHPPPLHNNIPLCLKPYKNTCLVIQMVPVWPHMVWKSSIGEDWTDESLMQIVSADCQCRFSVQIAIADCH